MNCSKCGAQMVKGSKTILGNAFACTRRNAEAEEEQNLEKVQPFCCNTCGYIEFYLKTET